MKDQITKDDVDRYLYETNSPGPFTIYAMTEEPLQISKLGEYDDLHIAARNINKISKIMKDYNIIMAMIMDNGRKSKILYSDLKENIDFLKTCFGDSWREKQEEVFKWSADRGGEAIRLETTGEYEDYCFCKLLPDPIIYIPFLDLISTTKQFDD